MGTYAGVTTLLGGQPTWEGAGHTFGWGAIAGSLGFGAGQGLKAWWRTPEDGAVPQADPDFSPEGRISAGSERPSEVPEEEWFQGIRDIANHQRPGTAGTWSGIKGGGGGVGDYTEWGVVRGYNV